MASTSNYYDLLGVTSKSDLAEIKRAYYAKMRQHHPDSFMAERTRLQIVGDQNALRVLDKRMDEAKKITQRLNVAYTILSDPDERAAYDRQQRDERERAWRAAQDDPRIVVKHRPHRRPTPTQSQHQYTPPTVAKPEKFPTVLAVIFVVILLISTTLVSSFFGQGSNDPRFIAPRKTPIGYIPAGSTDATATARAQITQQAIIHLTTHPPTLDTYIRAGDRLYEDGFYKHALESYSHALELEKSAAIYVKRGRVLVSIDQEWDARRDFTAALTLDEMFVSAYVERGLLIFAHWKETQNAGDAALARADLIRSQELGDQSDAVQAALDALP